MTSSTTALTKDSSPYRFKLSDREIEVLSMIVEGQSNPKIASALYLSPNTVKS